MAGYYDTGVSSDYFNKFQDMILRGDVATLHVWEDDLLKKKQELLNKATEYDIERGNLLNSGNIEAANKKDTERTDFIMHANHIDNAIYMVNNALNHAQQVVNNNTILDQLSENPSLEQIQGAELQLQGHYKTAAVNHLNSLKRSIHSREELKKEAEKKELADKYENDYNHKELENLVNYYKTNSIHKDEHFANLLQQRIQGRKNYDLNKRELEQSEYIERVPKNSLEIINQLVHQNKKSEAKAKAVELSRAALDIANKESGLGFGNEGLGNEQLSKEYKDLSQGLDDKAIQLNNEIEADKQLAHDKNLNKSSKQLMDQANVWDEMLQKEPNNPSYKYLKDLYFKEGNEKNAIEARVAQEAGQSLEENKLKKDQKEEIAGVQEATKHQMLNQFGNAWNIYKKNVANELRQEKKSPEYIKERLMYLDNAVKSNIHKHYIESLRKEAGLGEHDYKSKPFSPQRYQQVLKYAFDFIPEHMPEEGKRLNIPNVPTEFLIALPKREIAESRPEAKNRLDKYIEQYEKRLGKKQNNDKDEELLRTINSSSSDPYVLEKYMNPYRKQISDQLADEAAEHIKNKIIPAIASKYEGLGQSIGSGRTREAEELVSNLMKNVLREQKSLLHSGYNEARVTHASEQERALKLYELRQRKKKDKLKRLQALQEMVSKQDEREAEQERKDAEYENAVQQHPVHVFKKYADLVNSRNIGAPQNKRVNIGKVRENMINEQL